MRRKDYEITDRNKIIDILRRCDTVRIGIFGTEYPYVTPVSFGICVSETEVCIYFHSAQHGLKAELMEADPRVCVEGDIFIKTECMPYGITTRYESIIGFGTAKRVQGEEKIAGLKSILAHYGYNDYPLESCGKLDAAAVWKVTLQQITGKHTTEE